MTHSDSNLDASVMDKALKAVILHGSRRQRAARERTMQRIRLALGAASWSYLVAVLTIWALTWISGDRWWFATLILFAPRWIVALPLAPLLPLAAVVRRRLLSPLLTAAGVLLFGVMGLCVPWTTLGARSEKHAIRVLSSNVQGGSVDQDAFLSLIAQVGPDVVALQECSADASANWPKGWSVVQRGHLLIASRHSIDEVQISLRKNPPSKWPRINAIYGTVRSPAGPIGVCSVHLRTPRNGLSQVIDRQTLVSPSRSSPLKADICYRAEESKRLAGWISGFKAGDVIAGDFSMPVESTIYRDCWSEYSNAFSTAGFGLGHTKTSSIRGLRYGTRIDHVLLGRGWRASRCWVGPDVGSDHRPLVADVCLARQGE